MKKIGRNDFCPCGSGKKYKLCCINKLSEDTIRRMYLEQLELTNGLNDKGKCCKVLEIGKKIILNQKESICITGTYVNMAVAQRVLYFSDHNINDLKKAKEYCTKALELKSTNQAALRMMYGICLNLREYENAKIALEQFEDTNIYNPMCIQIVEEYQTSIEVSNREEHTEETKKGLDSITDILFAKFGMNAGLCAVAISYYLGVGNDVLKAYELGKRSIEQHPHFETYNSLGWICLNPELSRSNEAIVFFQKALELADYEEDKIKIKGNYFIALLENEKYELAEELMSNLISENPCNQNFSNYAELLKRQGKFDKALEWGKKALFLVEDDTTLLVVADIYKKLQQYDTAILMYERCINDIYDKGNVYRFKDVDGHISFSMSSNSGLDWILYEALKGTISVYSPQKKYEQAKAYLDIAKEKLPKKSDWEIWNQILPEIEKSNRLYIETKAMLDDIRRENQTQKGFFRQWALQLIHLQDDSKQLNLDEDDNWAKYEKEMDNILGEMVKLVNKESILYQDSENMVNSSYAHLDTDAKKFLITAEVLYEIHKTSIIDFAPIIVEYCKVVEKQLRVLLGSRLSSKDHMLGNIIGVIDNEQIIPYYNYLVDLRKINQMRRNSAHTGVLTKTDVDTIRNIFYMNNLLNNLI